MWLYAATAIIFAICGSLLSFVLSGVFLFVPSEPKPNAYIEVSHAINSPTLVYEQSYVYVPQGDVLIDDIMTGRCSSFENFKTGASKSLARLAGFIGTVFQPGSARRLADAEKPVSVATHAHRDGTAHTILQFRKASRRLQKQQQQLSRHEQKLQTLMAATQTVLIEADDNQHRRPGISAKKNLVRVIAGLEKRKPVSQNESLLVKTLLETARAVNSHDVIAAIDIKASAAAKHNPKALLTAIRHAFYAVEAAAGCDRNLHARKAVHAAQSLADFISSTMAPRSKNPLADYRIMEAQLTRRNGYTANSYHPS